MLSSGHSNQGLTAAMGGYMDLHNTGPVNSQSWIGKAQNAFPREVVAILMDTRVRDALSSIVQLFVSLPCSSGQFHMHDIQTVLIKLGGTQNKEYQCGTGTYREEEQVDGVGKAM